MPPRISKQAAPSGDRPQKTRRAFLYVTMTSLGVGACSVAWWMRASSSQRNRRIPAPPARGSLPWAERLLEGDEDSLLSAAGDIERLSLREPDHEALFATLFQRLFHAALVDLSERADLAAACALRGLERLDQLDLVADRVDSMRARADLRESNALWSQFQDRRSRGRGR